MGGSTSRGKSTDIIGTEERNNCVGMGDGKRTETKQEDGRAVAQSSDQAGTDSSRPQKSKSNSKKPTYKVHCPTCDALLSRVLDNTSAIVECHRCKGHISVVVEEGVVLVSRQDETDADRAVERLSQYQQVLQRISTEHKKECMKNKIVVLPVYELQEIPDKEAAANAAEI